VVEDRVRLAAGLPPRHGPANATLADYENLTPFRAETDPAGRSGIDTPTTGSTI
jgi:hypothetical protein